jgi:hypothetical protein
MVVIIFGKHQLGVLQHCLGVDLIGRVECALVADFIHYSECFFDLCLQLCLVARLFCFLVDGFDDAKVILVEIVSKHGI